MVVSRRIISVQRKRVLKVGNSAGIVSENREKKTQMVFGGSGCAGCLGGLIEKSQGFLRVAGAQKSFRLVGKIGWILRRETGREIECRS